MAQRPQGRSRETEIVLMRRDMDVIVEGLKEIKSLVESQYVTKNEFNPVQGIVYGAVKLVLGSVILSLIALVLSKTGTI